MNVTERQKSLLLQYMINHPDFGRGRLRYSSGNKKKLDDMWEEVSDILNASGAGPTKQAKEWAKTWRDWKSNTLKKIASFKSYGAGTGGGPPKQLITSKLEEELLDFLGPEASGLKNIRQGGFEHLARSEDMSFAPYPTDSNGTKKRKLSPMNTVLVEDVTPSTSNTIDSIDETDNAVYKWLEATNAADNDREMKEIQSEQNPSRTIEVKSKSAGKCARKKDPIDFLEEKKR